MKRFWELDAIRGIALLAMILFHVLFIMIDNQLIEINLYNTFWWSYARFTASIFVTLVGICLTISYQKAQSRLAAPQLQAKFILRGLKLIGMGLLITLITFFLFSSERAVYFGILHLLGLSIIIAYFLIRYTYLNLILGCLILLGGFFLGTIQFDFYWGLWLGLRPTTYYPVDYLPLLPWFGYILLGLFIGNIFYKGGVRRFKLPELQNIFIRMLGFLGRHSLIIYFGHFPVVYGLIIGIKALHNL